jgi:hypothetical protein
MKNINLLRRFAIGSLIMGLTVPMIYHVVLNASREQNFENLTTQICKAIEPRIQVGAYREALEYLQGVVGSQGLEIPPEVVFTDHGQRVTSPLFQERCRMRIFKNSKWARVGNTWNHVKNTQKS